MSKTQRDAIRSQQKQAELNQLMETDTEKFFDIQRQQYQSEVATQYLLDTTPTEQTIDEYRESSSGNYLKWPESIHLNKNKIIIHHTANDNTSMILTGWTGAAIEEMQAIYKYHTLTKWRWDIGYNFVIDPFGNIYEGRAWGAGVVGAHASRNNTPSVGISLMGNFNINVPTDAALKSLVNLTTALAKKYHIDPKSTVMYFKKSNEIPYLKAYTNYAVAWHEDAGVTSCPWTNLYNLLPELRDQVSEKLASIKTVSINVPVPKPVVDRWITVAWRYYSDQTSDTFNLPIRREGVTSCTTSDTTITINSCYSRNNELIVSLTKKWSSGLKTIDAITSSGKKKFSMYIIWKDDFSAIANDIKQQYVSRKWITFSSQSINKITSKISLAEVHNLVNSPLNVLLYELSVGYPRYEISCDGWCLIQADGTTYTETKPIVEVSNGFIYLTIPSLENPLQVVELEISSMNGGLVYIVNYPRKSYSWIPRNSFRWSLIWKKDTLKNLSLGKFVEQAVVINKLDFNDYMKGIAETSDSDNIEKQTLIMLLAKMYALFYINGENSHPSIPAGATYQAIDNPDMFQKYVGAGREKTSKMSATLLSAIQNKVVMYDGYVPILPYFSCSAGFTRSAKEKRWWNDTPYLQSRLDFWSCFDFNGHGVGLSGKWSQYLAEKWWTLEQILQYYYPWVTLMTIN